MYSPPCPSAIRSIPSNPAVISLHVDICMYSQTCLNHRLKAESKMTVECRLMFNAGHYYLKERLGSQNIDK